MSLWSSSTLALAWVSWAYILNLRLSISTVRSYSAYLIYSFISKICFIIMSISPWSLALSVLACSIVEKLLLKDTRCDSRSDYALILSSSNWAFYRTSPYLFCSNWILSAFLFSIMTFISFWRWIASCSSCLIYYCLKASIYSLVCIVN